MSKANTTTPYPLKDGCQSLASGATQVRTASGVGNQTRFVAIACTEAIHYAFGTSSVAATTSDTFLGANGEHFVRINPGEYVSVIQDSASGTVHVSEFAG